MTGQREWSGACVAGVAGALLCALHIGSGDGETRVLLILRAAIVFLAFAILAIVLLLMPRRPLVLSGGAILANVAALAYVFDVFRSSSGDLRASEALGIPVTIAALAQVGAFAIAAFASRRSESESAGG
jgi:hypothetical protein